VRGLFSITGHFQDGVPVAAGDSIFKQIELIDGDRQVELPGQSEFGLREAKPYEVDHASVSNYEATGGRK
jgi:hypothetical protein